MRIIPTSTGGAPLLRLLVVAVLMALLMGATMTLIMIGFMWRMYTNRAANWAICVAAAIVFAGSLWLVRSQETVTDVAYMKAMIPHHSIAVMTSERAHIRDPRVRKLADDIIEAQLREIGEMKQLIAELQAKEELASIRPPLDGREVMQHLGIEPGRTVGEALDFLLELRLEEGPIEKGDAFERLDAWARDRGVSG